MIIHGVAPPDVKFSILDEGQEVTEVSCSPLRGKITQQAVFRTY